MGLDNIHPATLKNLAEVFAKPLTLIFQASIDSEKLPCVWKDACVTPLFKKGSKNEPCNYRPVSLTSIVCKVLEKLIRKHIIDHLDNNRFISNYQYGFRNYSYETGSMTGILEELKWETLQKRRKDNRLILLYKGIKGKARIPTDDLIPKNRRCRNQQSLVFQIPTASKDAYKKSFFPQTIRDWNVLPDSLISSAELSDDCVSKFTSLGGARV